MVGGNDWDWWGWLLMVVHQGPTRELIRPCFVSNSFISQLFMIDNAADDWRIAMTWQRMMQVFVLYFVFFLRSV